MGRRFLSEGKHFCLLIFFSSGSRLSPRDSSNLPHFPGPLISRSGFLAPVRAFANRSESLQSGRQFSSRRPFEDEYLRLHCFARAGQPSEREADPGKMVMHFRELGLIATHLPFSKPQHVFELQRGLLEITGLFVGQRQVVQALRGHRRICTQSLFPDCQGSLQIS